MVTTKITFSKANVTPPVFVAGSFSHWQTIELDSEMSKDNSDNYVYSKTLDIPAGEHQYKFRLGDGDWWVTDESSPTVADDSGNLNNILNVQPKTGVESTSINNAKVCSDDKSLKDAKLSNIEESSHASKQYQHTNGSASAAQVDQNQDNKNVAAGGHGTSDTISSSENGLLGFIKQQSTTVWAAVFVVLIAGYISWR